MRTRQSQYIGLGSKYIFFFSSRRRHTRCSRDWSSDVCSSDLKRHHQRRDFHGVAALHRPGTGAQPEPRSALRRSEEHTSELQSRLHLVCRLLLEKKKNTRAHQHLVSWLAAVHTSLYDRRIHHI